MTDKKPSPAPPSTTTPKTEPPSAASPTSHNLGSNFVQDGVGRTASLNREGVQSEVELGSSRSHCISDDFADHREASSTTVGRQGTKTAPTMIGDLLWFGLCGFLCVAIGGGLTHWFRGHGEWELWILVGMVSFGVSLPTTFLIHSQWRIQFPAAAPLLATFWRSGSYFMLLLYLDATKWQVDNFAHAALMGCYFPYLVLESSLFIRQVSHHS